MGAYGLAWAQVIWAVFEVVVLFIIMSSRIPKIFDTYFIHAVARMASATGFMAVITYISVVIFSFNASDQSFFAGFYKFAAIVAISGSSYVLLSKLLNLKEVDPILERLANFFFKKYKTKGS